MKKSEFKALFITTIALLWALGIVVPSYAKGGGSGNGGSGKGGGAISGKGNAQVTTDNASVTPSGLAKEGKTPSGLEKQGKTPAGWSKGKKKGWNKQTKTGKKEESKENVQAAKHEKEKE